MTTLINLRQEEMGFKPLPEEIEMMRAMSFVKRMSQMKIDLAHYEKVFDMAIIMYNKEDKTGPFGVDHLIKAAMRFNQLKVEERVFVKPTKALPSFKCPSCKGSKISYKRDGDKIVGINYEAGNIPAKCEECYE